MKKLLSCIVSVVLLSSVLMYQPLMSCAAKEPSFSFEAENGQIIYGKIVQDVSAYGGLTVKIGENKPDSAASGIIWKANSDQAKTSTVTIDYSAEQDSTVYLVSGSTVLELNLSAAQNRKEAEISLVSGENVLQFLYGSGGSVSVDRLVLHADGITAINEAPVNASETQVLYFSRNARIHMGNIGAAANSVSGTCVTGLLFNAGDDNLDSAHLEFNSVYSEKGGDYQLIIFCAGDAGSTIDVSVNNYTYTLPINLPQGKNIFASADNSQRSHAVLNCRLYPGNNQVIIRGTNNADVQFDTLSVQLLRDASSLLLLEAEDAELSISRIYKDNNAHGGLFVTNAFDIASFNAYMRWYVNVPEDGNYTIDTHYFAQDNLSGTFYVNVPAYNGALDLTAASGVNADFPLSSAGYTDKKVTLNLKRGVNTITLKLNSNTSGNQAFIDYIMFEDSRVTNARPGAVTDADNTRTVYQAKDGMIYQSLVLADSYVGGMNDYALPPDHRSYVGFNNVYASEDGTFFLKLYYKSVAEGTSAMQLRVNDFFTYSFNAPYAAAFSESNYLLFEVFLHKGYNSIKIAKSSAAELPVDISRIEIIHGSNAKTDSFTVSQGSTETDGITLNAGGFAQLNAVNTTAGRYDLEISGTAGTVRVLVNGIEAGHGTFQNGKLLLEKVSFQEGENTIRLIADEEVTGLQSVYVRLADMTFVRTGAEYTSNAISYEAENADLTFGEIKESTDASNGAYVKALENSRLVFEDISTDFKVGKLRVYYAGASAEKLIVDINGTETELPLETSGVQTFQTESGAVYTEAEVFFETTNTITITVPEGEADIDRISITAADDYIADVFSMQYDKGKIVQDAGNDYVLVETGSVLSFRAENPYDGEYALAIEASEVSSGTTVTVSVNGGEGRTLTLGNGETRSEKIASLKGETTYQITVLSGSAKISRVAVKQSGGKAPEFRYTVNEAKNAFLYPAKDAVVSEGELTEGAYEFYSSDSFAQFTIHPLFADAHLTLKFYFAQGTDAESVKLSVGGKEYSTAISGGTAVFTVEAAAGPMSVRLTGNGSGNVIVRELETLFTDVSEEYTRYEAEFTDAAGKKGYGETYDYGTYSGLGFIGNIDTDTSEVRFRVKVTEDGEYNLRVCCASGAEGVVPTFRVYTQNGYYGEIKLTNITGWGNFGSDTVPVMKISLKAGENEIILKKGQHNAELDYIEIGAKTGAYKDPIDKPSGVTRLEAEDAELSAVVKKGQGQEYDYGTYSGTGFIGNIDTNTSEIRFKVHVEEDGEYDLYVCYASGAEGVVPTFRVYTQNGSYGEIELTKITGWGNFGSDTVAVMKISLKAGDNEIILKKGQHNAELDYIEIGAKTGAYKDPIEKQSDGVRYEAEDAALSAVVKKGQGQEYDYGTYSGTGFIGNIDTNASEVRFKVKAEADGEYDLRICYASGAEGAIPTFRVYTQNGYYGEIELTKITGWGNFGPDTVAVMKISLKAGDNEIIVKMGKHNAELDYIEIGAKTGDYKEPIDGSAGFTRFEAEDGVLTSVVRKGQGQEYDYGTYSGTGFIGNIDTDASEIRFKVSVEEDGEYDLHICYASGAEGAIPTFRVYTQNGYYGEIELTNITGWGNFGLDTVAIMKISLKAGENEIIIRKGQHNAELDYIEIGAKTGSYQEPLEESSDEQPSSGDLEFDLEDNDFQKLQSVAQPAPDFLLPILLGAGLLLVIAAAIVVIILVKRKRRFVG